MIGRGEWRRLRRWIAGALAVERGGAGALERLALASERTEAESGVSRRVLLGGALGATALAACRTVGGGPRPEPEDAGVVDDRRPAVAILGAGLAGLTCLHRLRARGIDAVLYERDERIGGRTQSERGLFSRGGAPRRTIELGGEFIDSAHTELLDLARELGLEVRDLRAPPGVPEGLARTYFVAGHRVAEDKLLEGFVPLAHAIIEARAAIGDEDFGYDAAPEAAVRFDRMPLAEFVAKAGPSAATRAVIDAAYTTEYGLALEDQSALNLIMMLSEDNIAAVGRDGPWALYGDSDERWQVVGGNARVCEELAARHVRRVRAGWALESLRERGDGGWTLSFEGGREVQAPVVVCTLPFTVLRTLRLDAELAPTKRKVIDELGYGNNSKLVVPFVERAWEGAAGDGSLYTDLDTQVVWSPDPWVRKGPGILSNFVGGRSATMLGNDSARAQATHLAAQLDKVWPGIRGMALVDDALRAHWPTLPGALGSYASYRVGQWTSLGGAEAEPAGTLLFAGEHTASDFQGYMGGAVEAGERAAREVVALGEGGRPTARRFAGRRAGRATQLVAGGRRRG